MDNESHISDLQAQVRELTDLLQFMQKNAIPLTMRGYCVLIEELKRLRVLLAEIEAEQQLFLRRQVEQN